MADEKQPDPRSPVQQHVDRIVDDLSTDRTETARRDRQGAPGRCRTEHHQGSG
jgi:hypothetical protein